MNVLLTGGAGYIGSHTAVELIAGAHSVVIVVRLLHDVVIEQSATIEILRNHLLLK